ncbi:hypothetical protein [Halorussus caseinilyticus]|uniref:Uncharacterized protein n=1 Tax=Halorussus caseinilyticus TaxID=3034025 RepID=A0ABD5WJV8_9EURY|nr:hypothetical protein [Halorussus sp. DT72]
MSDEEPTITVDLRNESEEWVQYAKNRKASRSEIEVDEQSLETETRRKLQRAIRQYLESLDNDVLDISTCFDLSDNQLFDRLAGIVVRQVRNVETVRNDVQKRLQADESVSAFELPKRTREATAEYLVEEAIGKAEIRSVADRLLDKERETLDTERFGTDTSSTETNWASDGIFRMTEGVRTVENRTRLNSRG